MDLTPSHSSSTTPLWHSLFKCCRPSSSSSDIDSDDEYCHHMSSSTDGIKQQLTTTITPSSSSSYNKSYNSDESFVIGKSTITINSILSTSKSKSTRSGKRVTFLLNDDHDDKHTDTDELINDEDECDSNHDNDNECQSNNPTIEKQEGTTDNEKALEEDLEEDDEMRMNNETTDDEETDDEDIMSEIDPAQSIPSNNVPQIINTSSNNGQLPSKTAAAVWERPTSQQLLIMMRQISAQQSTRTSTTTTKSSLSSSRHNNRRQYQRNLIIFACTSIALLTISSITTFARETQHLHHAVKKLFLMPSCWLSASFLFHTVLAVPTTAQQQYEQQNVNSNNDNNNDDNQSPSTSSRPLNYYELLNLETPTTHYNRHSSSNKNALHNRKKRTSYRNKIKSSDIKKAYRKMAQLYHPDKAKRHNMTIEEATNRFAEIANAYSILIDPTERYEYDYELLELEEQYENERILLLEEEKGRQRQQQQQQQNYHDMGGDATLYERIRNGASNFHTWKDTLDPWAVFEDFFFQDPIIMGSNDGDGANDAKYTGYQQQGRYQQQQYQQRPSESLTPRVSETTIHRGYDPAFGADIYTVLRREEYIHDDDDMNKKKQYYYQILGQDFVSGTRIDPYTGFTLQEYYSAVTEPYFVEDGWAYPTTTTTSEDGIPNTNFYNNNEYEQGQYQQYNIHEEDDVKYQKTHHQRRKYTSELEVGESFTPNNNNNNPWMSPNGKYQVILTSTCELQIISINTEDQQQPQNQRHQQKGEGESQANGDDDETNVIWSSETYIPNTRAHGCYLTLNTLGRLVLSVDYGSGLTSSLGNTVLWNTPTPPVVPHLFQADDDDDDEEDGNDANANQQQQRQPVTFRYYASLDDDGVIAVYRVREKIKRKNAASSDDNNNAQTADRKKDTQSTKKLLQVHRPIMDKLGGMYHRISKASARQGQTKAAIAWDHIRYNVRHILAKRPASTTYTHDRQHHQQEHGDRYNNSNLHHHHECVYATSPVGCLSPGRNAIHLSKKLARTLKRGVQTMDSHIDNFLSILTDQVDYDSDEENYGYYNSNSGYESSKYSSDDDDDEDLLDTLVRVTGTAGIQLGKAGMHGIKRGKKVAGKVVGKMKDKIGKHSTQWGERMAEKEEFF